MHIPDGYLSPATAAAGFAAAAPFWYQASKKARQVLRSESAPMLALFSAFCFTIQMFNFPLPGGTTAHAVGGTLAAIVLGPWPAVIAVSTALLIQSLFFGDGGITAIGANSFNMAIALPLVGYGVYRLLACGTPSIRRRVVAAAVGAYAGINVAGLLAGIELGIQPLFWSDGGRALYSPYGLSVTVPAMMLAHLTVAGFAEAALTALALSFLLRSHPELVEDGVSKGGLGKLGRGLVMGLGLMVVLTPIGLLAPGSADFEWGSEQLRAMVGYSPSGFSGLERLWGAPLSGYRLPGGSAAFLPRAQSYVLSTLIGVALIFAAVFALRLVLARRVSTSE